MSIEELLQIGSGYEGGRKRIYEYFSSYHPSAEKQKFLSNEYGIGGMTYKHGFLNHDSRGIEYKRDGEPDIFITWAQAAAHIDYLIAMNKYPKR